MLLLSLTHAPGVRHKEATAMSRIKRSVVATLIAATAVLGVTAVQSPASFVTSADRICC